MGNRIVKSVSFTNDEKELLDYVLEQGKFSDTIKKFIKKDMQGPKLAPEIRAEVLKLINEHLSGITVNTKQNSEVIKAIDDIFDM